MITFLFSGWQHLLIGAGVGVDGVGTHDSIEGINEERIRKRTIIINTKYK